MVDRYSGYGMPAVDFSILGDLPDTARKRQQMDEQLAQLAEQRRIAALRQQTLAGMKPGDYTGAGNALLGIGDVDTATNLLRMGLAERADRRAGAGEARAGAAEARTAQLFPSQLEVAQMQPQMEREKAERLRSAESRAQSGEQRTQELHPLTTQPGGAVAVKPGFAEAQRELADIKKPGDNFKDEHTLREEFAKGAKTHMEVRDAYGRVNASHDNAVGDISMIFAYMRMLDPTSTVREGEFATAQNAAGIPERVTNLYNKALKGERLTPAQRQSFKNQAGDLLKTSETTYNNRKMFFEHLARRYGMDPANVTVELPPLSAGAPNGTPKVPAPPPGYVVQ